MRTYTALALLGLLALAAVASAAPEKASPEEKKGLAAKERAKRDDEARESHESSFLKADTDSDGTLSKDEYKGFFRATLQKMKTVSTQAVESSDKVDTPPHPDRLKLPPCPPPEDSVIRTLREGDNLSVLSAAIGLPADDRR